MFKLTMVLLVLVLFAGVAQAGSWDLAADYSASNPTGAWTYGVLYTGPTDATWTNGNFYAYTVQENPGFGFVGFHMADGWDDEGSIGKNTGAAPIDAWGFYQEVGDVRIQGSNLAGFKPGAKWTCAESGCYAVSARFTGTWYPDGGHIMGVQVVQGSTDLFAGTLTGFIGTAAAGYTDGFGDVRELNYAGTVYADAGSSLLFVGGQEAADGGAYGATAGVSATIVTVPEPSSLLAFATGLIGVAGFAVRRKRK